MSSSNNRTINGYETIDGELVLSEITNQVLSSILSLNSILEFLRPSIPFSAPTFKDWN